MSASILFLIFSCLTIIVSLGWALVQCFREPPQILRIGVPVCVAIASGIALFSGVLARNQQSRELTELRPRSLSEFQRAEIKRKFSRETATIRIVYRLMDGEGKDYSDQIASAIRDAGGTVASVIGNHLNDLRGRVTVAVASGDTKTLNAADNLCTTLTEVGIQCGGEISPGSLGGSPERGEILLIVGRKD